MCPRVIGASVADVLMSETPLAIVEATESSCGDNERVEHLAEDILSDVGQRREGIRDLSVFPDSDEKVAHVLERVRARCRDPHDRDVRRMEANDLEDVEHGFSLPGGAGGDYATSLERVRHRDDLALDENARATMEGSVRSIQSTIKLLAVSLPPIPAFVLLLLVSVRKLRRERQRVSTDRLLGKQAL